MTYNYKEYTHIFETPAKRQQELVVVNKIMELLNKNKYDDINEFIEKNQTYQSFLKTNELENVVKHFGNTLNEEDYTKIIESIKKLSKDKQSFDKEEIKTTNIGNNEYTYFKGVDKAYFLDNSYSGMSIERQMEELQPTEEKFQTTDKKQNTENMMKELEKNKKESFNLKYINELNMDMLNENEKEYAMAAINFQLDSPSAIRIDIDKGVIVDENDNIFKIENVDGKLVVVNDENEKNNETVKQPRTLQKSLTPNPNTIYSANN